MQTPNCLPELYSGFYRILLCTWHIYWILLSQSTLDLTSLSWETVQPLAQRNVEKGKKRDFLGYTVLAASRTNGFVRVRDIIGELKWI